MTKLEYTFKNDTLFKLVFVKYPDLLKRLVSVILGIQLECIEQFEITNTEMQPEVMGDKFCRLDINMIVDGQKVDLEIQVQNEGDYTERSLYYWARAYSTALSEGEEYRIIPRTIIISIVAFILFPCLEYHSEYQPLEVTRHTPLNDKMVLHYFELPKLPKVVNAEDELKIWLALFNAETEEELVRIEATGVPVMKQAIEAFRQVTATDEFRELERLRSRARHNEASALGHAKREGYREGHMEGHMEGHREGHREADEKWQSVVADKDAALAKQTALIEELRAQLNKDN